MDEIKDKFHTNCDGAKEAFEELCAMFDAVQVRGGVIKTGRCRVIKGLCRIIYRGKFGLPLTADIVLRK